MDRNRITTGTLLVVAYVYGMARADREKKRLYTVPRRTKIEQRCIALLVDERQ